MAEQQDEEVFWKLFISEFNCLYFKFIFCLISQFYCADLTPNIHPREVNYGVVGFFGTTIIIIR